jgi:hypothetical protein
MFKRGWAARNGEKQRTDFTLSWDRAISKTGRALYYLEKRMKINFISATKASKTSVTDFMQNHCKLQLSPGWLVVPF